MRPTLDDMFPTDGMDAGSLQEEIKLWQDLLTASRAHLEERACLTTEMNVKKLFVVKLGNEWLLSQHCCRWSKGTHNGVHFNVICTVPG